MDHLSAVIILVLAAGASSRMGGADKLLQPVAGEALLRRSARIAAETGSDVLVTLPPDRPDRKAVLLGLAVQPLIVTDAGSGMSASLRAGVAAARAETQARGLMILPADMPDFTPAALGAMIAAFRARPDLLWRGVTAQGQQGHPAIFPRDLWDELAAITGDRGGLGTIRAHADRLRLFPLPGEMAVTDLDTPDDWAAWRARG